MHSTEEFLIFKSENEKNKIIDFLTNKKISIDDLTVESIVNSVSAAKNNLNEELKNLLQYKFESYNSNLYSSIIQAKNNQIDNLISLYNGSNYFNKTTFVNDIIEFNSITTIEKVKLEIDNFDYFIPINLSLNFYTYDGEIITKNIVPFDYNGLYNEYFEIKNNTKSLFKVANKNNLYFYTCIYNDKGFSLGSEIKLEKNIEYSFDKDGYLILDSSKIPHAEILVKYQPNENSFELTINKRCSKIELVSDNDKLGIKNKLIKRLVLFDE